MIASSAEQWLPLAEFPHYLISNYGNIRHVTRVDVRTITINERGFPVILLSSSSSPTRYLRHVNKLVAETFLPPPQHHDEIAIWHRDGDVRNCHVDNLMWETRPRVIEWNEMHRTGQPKYSTPPVKNNRTGIIYQNAYDCGMNEGVLESSIIWRIERQNHDVYDDNARYRYFPDE